MKVFIDKDNKKLTKKFEGLVLDLLVYLCINPETVIVVRNGEIITDEDLLNDSDTVEILSVISGG